MQRDSKGNIISDVAEKGIDWEGINNARSTYVFHYLEKKTGEYLPYFGIYDKIKIESSKANHQSNYYEKRLFNIPEKPPFDFYIKYYNWLLDLRVNYFKEVFEEKAFAHGYMPSHNIAKIILPKPLHDEICNTINNYDLLHIRDLIFEVISIAQQIYVDEIVFWEKPEMQKIITTAKSEADKLIQVIEKSGTEDYLRGEDRERLQNINFVFAKSSLKISHEWLGDEIIRSIKEHFDGLAYKNWRLDLGRYHLRYEMDKLKGQFKYRLAKSLYNLLSKKDFFNVNQRYPNDLMSCICKILEFCLIPVGSEGEVESVKIKTVRNWIKRNEISPAITFENIPPNKERLYKYFEKQFIDRIGDIKRADVIFIGLYVGKRFGIPPDKIPDLIHLAQGLKDMHYIIGHQFSTQGLPDDRWFDEFSSFNKLIRGVSQNKKLSSIKFIFEGENIELNLTSELPLHIIQNAIKNYSKDHEVELDSDLVKTDIIEDDKGHVGFKRGNLFNTPKDRFMITFVKNIYEYLLHEIPPEQYEYSPSERYYRIIGMLFQESWFFNHKNHSEEFIIDKMKEWHSI